jgi:AcrR family transcriptional regulator
MARRTTKTEAKSQIGKRRAAARSESSEYYSGKRQAMLEAAARLFKEHGVSNTTLDDVAREAGIDRSTAYYYVSNREELFFEVVGAAMETMAKEAEDILALENGPEEKLRALMVHQMSSYAKNFPHLYVMLQERVSTITDSDNPRRKRLLDLSLRYENVFRKIIAEGIEAGAFRKDVVPTLMVFAAIGMTNWTHRWFEPNRLLSGQEVGEAFASIMLQGIKP